MDRFHVMLFVSATINWLQQKRGMTMILEDLIHQFILIKKRMPSHANELLDYIQKGYICGELSINEYKELFFELKKRKAKKPIFLTYKHNHSIGIQAL
jgi:YppF-like protein